MRSTRIDRFAAAVAAGLFSVLLLGVPGALAAKPIKGAFYEPGNGEPQLTFRVSADGRSLTHLEITGAGINCPVSGGGFDFPSHATVSGSHVTIHAIGKGGTADKSGHRIAPAPLGEDSATITGAFSANGSFKGTLHSTYTCINAFVTPVQHSTRHGSGRFTSDARPRGPASSYCPDTTFLKGIYAATHVIAVSVACAPVEAAVRAGALGPVEGFAARKFTTPGWTCSASGQEFGFTIECSAAPKAGRFSFFGEVVPGKSNEEAQAALL